jgi:ubiquinone/menaquinone biosynthesis C-methylase UbiE
MFRDNFSKQAGAYAAFRPGYPDKMFDFILSQTKGRQRALDVATGNGQVAVQLASFFEMVDAIDMSEKQLLNARRIPNIRYELASAEATHKKDKSYDLITVGQAAHWFRLKEFYEEAQRIIVPGGTLALCGYCLPTIDSSVDEVLLEFYEDLLGPYWDTERRLVDDQYRNLYFPFEKIPAPEFEMTYEWSFDQLTGFLSTWSAVQHYKNLNQSDPLELFVAKFRKAWGNDTSKQVIFPVFLLMSRL